VTKISHYRESLKEIGRLAAALDGDPIEVMRDFFKLSIEDIKIVLDEYQDVG
jgi:hypothetical protein